MSAPRPLDPSPAPIAEDARARAILQALAARESELMTPALVLDLDTVADNIAALRAAFSDRWRPHVKTVKQQVVITALLDAGVRSFKCATLRELDAILCAARARGCESELDILLAYPLHGPALGGFVGAQDDSTARLRTLADDPAHLATLLGWLPPEAILLDLDVGMGRTGSTMARWTQEVLSGDSEIAQHLGGFHAYEGHVRDASDPTLGSLYDELGELASTWLRSADQVLVTSGTPACLAAAAHPGLGVGPFRHQLSPGTLVLSDLRSAPIADALGIRPAAFVASRVVHRGERRCTLDAGSKALGADGPGPHAALLDACALEVAVPSEEHLPVRAGDDVRLPSAGELVLLVPAHVCTTVNLHERALWYTRGRIVGDGPIDARGHEIWRFPRTTAP